MSVRGPGGCRSALVLVRPGGHSRYCSEKNFPRGPKSIFQEVNAEARKHYWQAILIVYIGCHLFIV